MKKAFISAVLCLLLAGCAGNTAKIKTSQGTFTLTAMNDNAVRIQLKADLKTPELQELIYIGKEKGPKFHKKNTDDGIRYSLNGISILYNQSEDRLTFFNKEGDVILQETSRQIAGSSVSGVPCYDVTEAFDSPADEHLYGTFAVSWRFCASAFSTSAACALA